MDPSGDPLLTTYLDFTGCAARMQVRQNLDPASFEYFALTVGSGIAFSSTQPTPDFPAAPAFNNSFTVTITKAQTLTLPNAATLYYDLFIDYPSGVSVLFLQGQVNVGTTVTR